MIQDGMPGSLSIDLRKRAVAEYRKGGMTYADVAEQFSVGEATVNRWLRLERETGDLAPRSRPGRRHKMDEAGLAVLHQLVLKRPDARPASSSATFVVAISVMGTNVSPIPIDCGTIAGNTSPQ